MLDGRAGGDADRARHLGRDDHRSVVLPRPGAPESSTWSAVPPRGRAASQDQVELLAHPRLADELAQVLGPQRCLDGALLAVGLGADERARRAGRVLVALMRRLRVCLCLLVARRRHRARFSVWRAARSRRDTGGSPAAAAASACGATAATASSASRGAYPRPTSAACSWSRQPPPAGGGRRCARRRCPSGAPSRSFSSSSELLRALLPDAGHGGERLLVPGRDGQAQRVRASARRAWPARAAGRRRWRSGAARRPARSSSSAKP